MRSFTVSILCGFIFLCGKAFASPETFSGTWSGKGTYILHGDMTQCSQFQLVFSATDSSFTFVSGNRSCEKHEEVFYKVTMTYKNGGLFFGDQRVGSYDGNYLQTAFSMPDGNSTRHWRMSMRRQGDHLIYEESRTMDGEVTPMISFAGLLIRQN